MDDNVLDEKSELFTTTFKKELHELITGKWKPSEDEFLPTPIFHGEKLREAIDKALDERTPLIEGFLYEHGVTMVYADDGLGKSTVILNLIVEASAGLPAFKGLPCPKPLNTIWICAERPLDEPFERIKLMEQSVRPNLDNLVFDKEVQGMDLMSKEGVSKFMLRLTELESVFGSGHVDIVVIDPIYALGGDLSNAKDIHNINNILRTIQKRFDCAIIYTHHTNRGSRGDNGQRVDGDMYGSRFLSANVTGAFHLKETEDGVDLNCKKNTYGNLLKHIPLIYDEVTQTLTISADTEDFNKRDKILLFLRKKHAEKKEFALRSIANELKVSDAYIRKTISPFIKTGHIINKNQKGAKGVYYVEKNV
jgi:RecA-family ATPase